jgi:hypothetical protein
MTGLATEHGTPADVGVTTFYDSTVIDNAGRYSLTLAVLPDRERTDYPLASISEVADLLGLKVQVEVPDVAYLPHAFAAVLAGGETSQRFVELSQFSELSSVADWVDIDPGLLRFAEYCTVEPVVAIEQSPLHKVVLAALITAGATVAIAAAPVGGPLVIAYFGGSILVGGAAAVVVQATANWVDKKFP